MSDKFASTFLENRAIPIVTEAARVLANSGSPKTAITQTLEMLRETVEFRRCFVVFYSAANDKLQPFAVAGMNANEFRRLENRAGKSFLQTVYDTGKTVVVPRATLEPTFGVAFETAAETSCVGVPIFLNNRIIGAFGAEFDYQAAREGFGEIVDFLNALAAMFAQTIKIERQIALEKERLQIEQNNLQRSLREQYDFGQIIGSSGQMRQVMRQVAQIARAVTPVLLRGESGTGKEIIAKSIHFNSLRAKKAFVTANLSALPPDALEIELFGQTGKNAKKGRLEQAEGGTLFLDEIGDLPASAQAKLLSVLEKREFERAGSSEVVKANVRVVAATDKNLEELIAHNVLRPDLFYRMGVFTIFLPPLRERKADILLLAEHFVEKYEREHNKHIKRISTPAIDMLTSYHFPGNVRELENAIERAVIVCDSNVIHGHHLPPTLQTAELSGTITSVSLEASVTAFERDLISDALKTSSGNCAKAAKLLDTTERILNYKIKKYNIEPNRFRQ